MDVRVSLSPLGGRARTPPPIPCAPLANQTSRSQHVLPPRPTGHVDGSGAGTSMYNDGWRTNPLADEQSTDAVVAGSPSKLPHVSHRLYT